MENEESGNEELSQELKRQWMELGMMAAAAVAGGVVGEGYGNDSATPREVSSQQVYGDCRQEIIVKSDDRNSIFTQDETGKYISIENAMERERCNLDLYQREELSEIESKLAR